MRRVFVALVFITFVVTGLTAQTKAPKTVRRAQPPPPAKLRGDLFYADAFKEGLVGERPFGERRPDEGRRDCVDRNPTRRPLDRERLGQAVDRMLAGAVRGASGGSRRSPSARRCSRSSPRGRARAARVRPRDRQGRYCGGSRRARGRSPSTAFTRLLRDVPARGHGLFDLPVSPRPGARTRRTRAPRFLPRLSWPRIHETCVRTHGDRSTDAPLRQAGTVVSRATVCNDAEKGVTIARGRAWRQVDWSGGHGSRQRRPSRAGAGPGTSRRRCPDAGTLLPVGTEHAARAVPSVHLEEEL